jgi:predicted nucleic acid-binding protein
MMREDAKIQAKVSALQPLDCLVICPPIRGEILFGIGKMPLGRRRRDLEAKAQSLFGAFESKDINDSIADQYAQLKCQAKIAGKSLSDNDLWIAATAIYHNAILVAADKDYTGLSGLTVENWTR